MLIGFIGSPHSGKTSIATKLFNQFKDDGISSEFIAEEARKYIAKVKYKANKLEPRLKPWETPVTLTDEDQLVIMAGQYGKENVFAVTSPPDTLIVSDSSPINTLLYLSEEALDLPQTQSIIAKYLAQNPLLFVSLPVNRVWDTDTNRIHSPEQSQLIEAKIPDILKRFEVKSVKILSGSRQERFLQASSAVLERLQKDGAIPDAPEGYDNRDYIQSDPSRTEDY